eukprot:591900-Pelagomonas_calceolata.AAC.2
MSGTPSKSPPPPEVPPPAPAPLPRGQKTLDPLRQGHESQGPVRCAAASPARTVPHPAHVCRGFGEPCLIQQTCKAWHL